MNNNQPKLSRRQKFYHFVVTSLAEGGRKKLDENEPKGKVRKALFKFFRRRQWNEGKRLRDKYGTHVFKD